MHTLLENALWDHAKFMLGRPRCAIGQEFVQKHVIVWNEGHDWPHNRRGRPRRESGGAWNQSSWHSVGPPNVCDDPVATHPPRINSCCGTGSPFCQTCNHVGAFGALCVGQATCFLRVVSPEQSFQFATSHDTALWECFLGAVVGVPTRHIRSSTHMSVCAVCTAAAAYWASWG